MTPERCPSCGALTRPSQEWCTLCHRSFVATETLDPLTAPLEQLLIGEAAPQLRPAADLPETSLAAHVVAGPAEPVAKHARHAAQPTTYALADADAIDHADTTDDADTTDEADNRDARLPDNVDAMLAQLALQQRLPTPKVLTLLPDSRSLRLVVSFAGAMLLAVLAWALFWLVSVIV